MVDQVLECIEAGRC